MSKIVGGCAGTQYGCCPDGKTSRIDKAGSNCPLPSREYDQILSGNVTIKKVSSDNYTHKITFSKKNISKVLMYQVWSDSSVELNNDRRVKEVDATTWVKQAFRKTTNSCICTKEYDPVICPNGKVYSNNCVAACASQTKCKSFDVDGDDKDLTVTDADTVAVAIPFTPTVVMELDDGECPQHHKAKNCKHNDECRHVFVIKRALVNKCDQVVFYVSSEDIVLPSNPNNELKLLKTIPTGGPYHRARFDIDTYNDSNEIFLKRFLKRLSLA
jgi:hypothetical protein